MSYIDALSQPAPRWPGARSPEAEEETRPTEGFDAIPPEAAELPPEASQKIAEAAPPGQSGGEQPPGSNLGGGVVEEFLKWARMSPAEQVRAMYLEEQGMTEDTLKALPPEERQRIEFEIANRIEHEVRTSAESPAEQNIRVSINASYAQSMQRVEEGEQEMWGR